MEKKKNNRYRDLWMRLAVSLPSAHVILILNEPDSFIELIRIPGYPLLLGQNYIMIFLLISLIRSITIFLNRNFPWHGHPKSRMIFQLFFGVGIPSLFTLVLASLFFRYHGLDMFETSYMKLEWQLAILYIIVFNCYYLLYHMRTSDPRNTKTTDAAGPENKDSSDQNRTDISPCPPFQLFKNGAYKDPAK